MQISQNDAVNNVKVTMQINNKLKLLMHSDILLRLASAIPRGL